MSKKISFDFCVIPNPFSSGSRNMIFIAKSGETFLNKKVADSKEYKDIKDILEKFGYTETSYLQFDSSSNSSATESTAVEMKKFLKSCGLSYSRELEVSMVRGLNHLKNETDSIAQDNIDFIYGNGDAEGSSVPKKTENKLIESKKELFNFKYEEPYFKEKVSLYFYLFLEFGFNEKGRPVIQFGGNFSDSEDCDDRNYIKIVKSEFERIGDKRKPNSIVLMSTKTQGDFLKEVGILYSGYFKYQKRIETMDAMMLKESKFTYKLAEVKRFLDPEKSIVVETNRMGYDRLIGLSKKIKAESIVESNKYISTGDIKYEAEELSQFLTKKIKVLSNKEEFEDAALMMKDINFIKDKIALIDKLDKTEITTEEYFKHFSSS